MSMLAWVQGAAHVSAYVTHGVFPNGTWQRFTPENRDPGSPGFKYFWISDSCADSSAILANIEPFEILSRERLRRQPGITGRQPN